MEQFLGTESSVVLLRCCWSPCSHCKWRISNRLGTVVIKCAPLSLNLQRRWGWDSNYWAGRRGF